MAQQCIAASVGVLLGIVTTTVWQFSLLQFLVYLSFVLLLVLIASTVVNSLARWVTVALLLGLVMGSWRGWAWELTLPPTAALGQTNTIRGSVISEFTAKGFRGSFVLQPEQGSRIMVQVASDRTVAYGDMVQVRGKLEPPPELDTFNYPRYLASQGVVAQLKAKEVIVLIPHSRRWTFAPLFALKEAVVHRLNQVVPTPASGLLVGMVLGDKSGIPPEWIKAFQATGLSHIVAVSGYNVSILIGTLASGYQWLGRRRLLLPLLVMLLLFAFMTGGSSSVWRAVLMAVILLIGQRLGRQYDARTALWTAAAVLALVSPLVVIADVGYQLSVLATAGIVYGVPLVLFFVPERLRQSSLLLSVVVSLSAIVATLPLILYQFGQVSVVALPVNMLVVPVVPLLMLLAGLSLLPVVGGGVGFVAATIVMYLMRALMWVSQWAFAQRAYTLSLVELMVSFVVLAFLAWLGNRCAQLSRRVNS